MKPQDIKHEYKKRNKLTVKQASLNQKRSLGTLDGCHYFPRSCSKNTETELNYRHSQMWTKYQHSLFVRKIKP